MASVKLPPQSVIDARFRAKLEARTTGSTPVMVEAPAIPVEEDLDAKAREKLARHRAEAKKQSPAPAEKPPEPEAQSRQPEPEASAQASEGQERHQSGKHGGKHDHRKNR